MRLSLKAGWRTVAYFAVVALFFLAFAYLGVTRGFSNGLDIGFVALLWVFVTIAMKTGFIRVPPGTSLPLATLNTKLDAGNLLRALLCAALAIGWTGASVHFVHAHTLDDSWYGIALVAVPMVVFLVLFVRFLIKGFEIRARDR
jgi:hypothetical protein